MPHQPPILTPQSSHANVSRHLETLRPVPCFSLANLLPGLQLPPETNPADWILDMMTSLQTLPDGKTLSEAYRQRNKGKSLGVSHLKHAAGFSPHFSFTEKNSTLDGKAI